ncbi:BLUF domain-containing protein [Leisingera aquaemixtae]|uniref:BLUF domain-containing protein n=1 Tax=Leisingera aquaemixtae TaxID=1396826 RepID=UPI001C953F32|nr:BLUF domain-containing protein [Leisingera aquaemixtae]MBY6065676.1 BLUF domain-containing protein [Leisingera aquaemixtae]
MEILHRIVYLSSAARALSDSDIETILATARQRNAQDGITGLMLFHDGSFLQVLEGPRAAVEACYARIVSNQRHHQIARMSSKDVDSRIFSEWEMASLPFSQVSREAQDSFHNIRDLQASETMKRAENDPVTKAFLKTFLLSLR